VTEEYKYREKPRNSVSTTLHTCRVEPKITGKIFSSFDSISIEVQGYEFNISVSAPYVSEKDASDPFADWEPGDGIKLFKAAVTNMEVRDYTKDED
jgi:hypothetical protein